MDHQRLALTSVAALILGLVFGPRPGTLPEWDLGQVGFDAIDALVPLRSHLPMRSAAPLPMGVSVPSSSLGSVDRLLSNLDAPLLELEPEPRLGHGWLSGHVVDGNGLAVGGAVLHLRGTAGVEAHRIADDGEFHLQVTEGAWTVEAGWFDGEDEWRSRAMKVSVQPGSTSHLAVEILLNGAAHAVHAGLREAMGMGFEVLRNDGPLQEGDVLVEVDGKLLVDLQPEAVRAALRERPGEQIEALVLRPRPGGAYDELTLWLEAR